MDTWERLKIGAAVAGTALLMFALHVISDLVYPETYVARPGFKVAGVSEPTVDLAALQRSWPAGLAVTGGRAQLRDYMSNIEKVALPQTVEALTPRSAALPAAADTPPDWGSVLPKADVAAGQATFAKCQSCHTLGANAIGPNLVGVEGRKPGTEAGFSYSPAMQAFGAKTPIWDYDHLYAFLRSPQAYVQGTKMTFMGLTKPEDRINLIAYLHTQGSTLPTPPPRPSAAAVASEATGRG